MKRSALARRTPMKRGPMRRRPRSTSYSRRERDTDRMGWIKTQLCAVTGTSPEAGPWRGPKPPDQCQRAVEAHHAGRHGLGQKSDDDTCVPLCDHHHDALTDLTGVFNGWPPGALREWQNAMIERYRARYETRLLGLRTATY